MVQLSNNIPLLALEQRDLATGSTFSFICKGPQCLQDEDFLTALEERKRKIKCTAEKHIRGAAARSIKAMRRTKMETKTNKSLAHKGNKCRKHFHKLDPSGTKETNHVDKNRVNELRQTF